MRVATGVVFLRVAAGGLGRGLLAWRSALARRLRCGARLGAALHNSLRAPAVHCAQTGAASQFTKRVLRTRPAPRLRSSPPRKSPTSQTPCREARWGVFRGHDRRALDQGGARSTARAFDRPASTQRAALEQAQRLPETGASCPGRGACMCAAMRLWGAEERSAAGWRVRRHAHRRLTCRSCLSVAHRRGAQRVLRHSRLREHRREGGAFSADRPTEASTHTCRHPGPPTRHPGPSRTTTQHAGTRARPQDLRLANAGSLAPR